MVRNRNPALRVNLGGIAVQNPEIRFFVRIKSDIADAIAADGKGLPFVQVRR